MANHGDQNVNEQIEKTTILAVYSAIVAACYLAAFWSRFDINIFQFTGITGFASLALYPLMTALGLNVFMMLYFDGRAKNRGATTGTYKPFVLKIAKIFVVSWWVIGTIGALAAFILMSSPWKWGIILLGTVPLMHSFADLPIAQIISKDGARRRDIVYWAFSFPLLAAMNGGLHADIIIDGKEPRAIAPTGAAKNLQSDEAHPIGFLGFSGGTYFLYESKSGDVVMINQSVAEPLTFRQRTPKAPSH